jgi:hypothetical protein
MKAARPSEEIASNNAKKVKIIWYSPRPFTPKVLAMRRTSNSLGKGDKVRATVIDPIFDRMLVDINSTLTGEGLWSRRVVRNYC